MELFIFNKELELIHIIDVFNSLCWRRKYYEVGEFELEIELTDDILKYLKIGNIIYKKDDLEAGYINTIRIDLDNEGKEVIKVSGKFLTNYIGGRIVWDTVTFNGAIENYIRNLVDKNCINTTINRKIPKLELGILKNLNDNINCQTSYKNIIEELTEVLTTYEIGYRIELDYRNKKLLFQLYKGIDRSINQQNISPCVFSREFENVLSQSYFNSNENLKTTALIAGEGEGKDRVLTEINNNVSGLDRLEIFVDARDLKKESNDNTLTEEEYLKILQQRGKEKLYQNLSTNTFEGTINLLSNNSYKRDFELGDIVTILDRKWNITINTRITEIEEVYENGGKSINVIFGNKIPTILDKIKSKVR